MDCEGNSKVSGVQAGKENRGLTSKYRKVCKIPACIERHGLCQQV